MQTRRTNDPGGSTILHTPVHPIARWLSTWLIVALVAACGGGGGGGSSEPGNPGTPPLPGFRLVPARLALTIGADGMLLALQAAGALTWSSSDPAVASVDAQGQVMALAAGSAVISATSGAAVSSATVKVYPITAPTPTALIATALAQNRITAEQALTYRVFALFGDQRLPAEFEGASDGVPMLMRQVSNSLPTLSQATKDTLLPFLLPPIYAQSWYAQQLGLPPAAAGARAHPAAAPTTEVNCDAATYAAFWKRLSTQNFNIHYFAPPTEEGDPYYSTAAAIIASVVEEVFDSETDLLQRFPLSDIAENCNGGSDAVDIYLISHADRDLAGIVQSYPDRCNNVPSYIAINVHHAAIFAGVVGHPLGRGRVKAVVAHEFAHVLQLAMDRKGGSCEDYEWLDEATAEWVMDFVGPTVNIEDGMRKFADNRNRTGFFYGQYLFSDHMASIENPGRAGNPKRNGYADYIFFQYLARKYDAQAIKQIFDATLANASVEAVEAALASKGGMQAVWPAFALTLWNDSFKHVLEDFSLWDSYDYGLAAIFERQVNIGPEYAEEAEKLKTIEIDQKGERRATFKLLENALVAPGGFYQIQPRSVIYEHLKFSDPTVHSVYFFNPIAALPNLQFMKVQAKKKVGGQWKDVEDWTGIGFKQFCLDKMDERLEELLIVVSNSEVNRGVEEPFLIPNEFPMRVSTSNVGCWRWQGTASTQITSTAPLDNTVTTASAIVQFEAVPTQIPGRITFETSAGVVNGVRSGTIGIPMVGTCSIDSFAADTPIVKKAPPDGTIDINLDLDIGFGLPPDRNLITLAGNSILSTRQTLICPGVDPVTTTENLSWTWLQVDDLSGREVSADGQKIEGEFVQSNPVTFTTIRTLFNFSAMRE